LFQPGISFGDFVISDCEEERFFAADDSDELSVAGDAGVEKVSL
jgi:hypothetical protein